MARAIADLNGNVNPVSSNKSNEVAESIDADRGYVLVHGEVVLTASAEGLAKDPEVLASAYMGKRVEPSAPAGAPKSSL